MSLNQKYTWHDFLKENPDFREKKTKRTSPEGKKAFDSAYRDQIKKYLVERSEKIEKLVEKARAQRVELVVKTKELRKAKRIRRVKEVDRKIGRIDAAVARLCGRSRSGAAKARHTRSKDRPKEKQKAK